MTMSKKVADTIAVGVLIILFIVIGYFLYLGHRADQNSRPAPPTVTVRNGEVMVTGQISGLYPDSLEVMSGAVTGALKDNQKVKGVLKSKTGKINLEVKIKID